MGWISGFASQAAVRQVIQHRTDKVRAQKSTACGRHLWTVYETPEGVRVLILDLIEKRGDRDWGYKTMDEGMHPYTYDCPLALLALLGEPRNEDAKNWRKNVLAQHVASVRTYMAGDEVLVYGKRYTVVGPTKRSYLIRSTDTGKEYRCSAVKMTPA